MNIKYTKNNKYSTQKILKLVHTKSFLFLIEYCPSSTCHIIFISILKSWSAIFFSERESLCLRSPLSPTQWLQKVCRLWAKIGKHERKSQTSGKAFEWERCSSERDSRQLSRSECTIFLTWWAMLTFTKSVAGHLLLEIGSKRSERCMLLPKPLHGQVSQVLHTDCTINRKFPWHLW